MTQRIGPHSGPYRAAIAVESLSCRGGDKHWRVGHGTRRILRYCDCWWNHFRAASATYTGACASGTRGAEGSSVMVAGFAKIQPLVVPI